MSADEAVVAVFAALDAAAIPYMLVGSLASNFHGIPRSTRDADFVIALSADSLRTLDARLPAGLILERQGAFEAVTGTMRYLIVLADSPFVCELFVLSDDAHDRERFARRQSARVLSHAAYVASAEDMIITKLRWAVGAQRGKDRDDIRNILAVRGAELDWAYIDRWALAHDTAQLLAQIKASVPSA